MQTRELGRFGEEQAAKYLRRRGYTVTVRNFSCRAGEIDIIAENQNFVVFAEVKLRRDANFAEAREFVTPAKQQRIINPARLWLGMNDCEKQPRFDVIEVYAPHGALGRVSINHIENAFM